MMYAVYKQSIRWYFSPNEIEHLFENYDLTTLSGAIKPSGTWKHGLTFHPLIYRNANSSYFPLVKIVENGLELYTIVTPIDVIKLGYNTLKDLTSAQIKTDLSEKRKLVVFPNEVVEFPQDISVEISSDISGEFLAEKTPENIDSKVEEMQTSSDIINKIETSENQIENIELAKLLVDDINCFMITTSGLTPKISSDGKVLGFMRVVKRRQMV